ncbi:MAG: lysylphosphatidylglycerol synthase transmembrane domain-containing protein [Phycisphaerae bacterium]|nr:lysylphosphatidylglycerol synthase transmembrane domain-containing protein [Phycisphaerae bacterium]
MSKWLKNILAIVILAFLIWYLAGHRQQLSAMLKLNPNHLPVLYGLLFLASLTTARVVQSLLATLDTKTPFWEMVWLQNASLLLNYAPMKFGTLFRANYLKRHYGLVYSRFAPFFLYLMFLMTATAAGIGLLTLVMAYGLSSYENKIMAGVFAAAVIGSMCFLLVPLPLPKGSGRLMSLLRNFITGRRQIAGQAKTIFTSMLFLGVSFLFTGLRLWIIYRCIGSDIHLTGCFILGAVGFVVLFVSITPGALGIRELVLASGAVVLGVPLEVGILAAMIDRAVILSYVFVVGGVCTLWLWHKSPADFKKQQNNTISQDVKTVD